MNGDELLNIYKPITNDKTTEKDQTTTDEARVHPSGSPTNIGPSRKPPGGGGDPDTPDWGHRRGKGDPDGEPPDDPPSDDPDGDDDPEVTEVKISRRETPRWFTLIAGCHNALLMSWALALIQIRRIGYYG